MAGQMQACLQRTSPARLNELQIAILGRAIDFVSNHGMTGMSCVDTDLMGAAGERMGFNQRMVCKRLQDAVFGHRLAPLLS